MNTIRNFRRKILQLSIPCTKEDHIQDLGLILVDAFDQVESFGDLPEKQPKLPQLSTEMKDVQMEPTSVEETKGQVEETKSTPKTTNAAERSWIPQNLEDKEMGFSSDAKDKEFIKYRLNNPRITKKGDKTVSEGMCNAYFEQRRNVLTQLLESFKENDVVIHPLMKKQKPKTGKSKTVGSKYRGVSKNKHKWQVMIMGNFKKFYIGGIKTEMEAAKLYDKLAIFYHGMEAKTNFQYTKVQIEALIAEPMNH
ncbi:unnamed protein product [Moneuplotes crassus]|uniref:AP2/ERF domain-containing protein n=1 Tax=Euplotes crassus TaxID=5936 RepID=A0AAD1XBI4_EUPCR|nr:unnamed protein product [Moneuplotes crassus]